MTFHLHNTKRSERCHSILLLYALTWRSSNHLFCVAYQTPPEQLRSSGISKTYRRCYTKNCVKVQSNYLLASGLVSGVKRNQDADDRESIVGLDLCFQRPTLFVNEPIYHSYPKSWLGNVFSSVPKRDLALEGISMDFKGGTLTLLVGPSASGKSTLLNILAGKMIPTKGTVQTKTMQGEVNIVLVDRYYATGLFSQPNATLQELVVSYIQSRLPKGNSVDIDGLLCTILEELATTLGLEAYSSVSDLTTSQRFLARILCAASESTLANCVAEPKSHVQTIVPSPILLLDELLDSETKVVGQNVASKLRELCQRTGAIVVAATHRPEHFLCWADRKVTMVGGRTNKTEKLR